MTRLGQDKQEAYFWSVIAVVKNVGWVLAYKFRCFGSSQPLRAVGTVGPSGVL